MDNHRLSRPMMVVDIALEDIVPKEIPDFGFTFSQPNPLKF